MSDEITEQEATSACDCKLGESAWKYDRMELLAEVGNDWAKSPDDAGISTKTLQQDFNRSLVEAAARDEGAGLLDGEAENYRRLLSDSSVDTGSKTEAKRRLGKQGINANALENSFVAETTVHKHLVECLGLEYNRPDPTTESSLSKLRQAERQFEGNVRGALRQQGLEDEVDRVSIQANVVCRRCGEIHNASQFLVDGCDCSD